MVCKKQFVIENCSCIFNCPYTHIATVYFLESFINNQDIPVRLPNGFSCVMHRCKRSTSGVTRLHWSPASISIPFDRSRHHGELQLSYLQNSYSALSDKQTRTKTNKSTNTQYLLLSECLHTDFILGTVCQTPFLNPQRPAPVSPLNPQVAPSHF